MHPSFLTVVTDEAYKEALRILDSDEKDDLISIENRFFEKSHHTAEMLDAAKKAGDSEIVLMRRVELDKLYQAYKDIRTRKHYMNNA